MNNVKTYVLTVSRFFPTTHKRKGEPTCFVEKIMESVDEITIPNQAPEFLNFTRHNYTPKLHTIRSNYPLWERRIKEVQEGKAVLSLRYWSGRPYSSKQVEFAVLDKDSGCGIQDLIFLNRNILDPIIAINSDCLELDINDLYENDGLSFNDFKEWFKKYDLSKPMAIIHFTRFRY